MSSHMTGFGTGKDETVLNSEQAMQLIEREQTQIPNWTRFKAEMVSAEQISDTLSLIMASVTHEIVLGDTRQVYGPARYSALLQKEDDGWKIVHLHVSEPWIAQKEGEAYPIKQLEEQNKQLNDAVARKTRELRKALARLEKIAITDQLTGVFNRYKLEEIIEDEVRHARRYQNPLSLILLDFDYFKQINDIHGHLKGDSVFRKAAKLIRSNLRDVDALARWGGDEFIILLPDQGLSGAALVAERIGKIISKSNFGIPTRVKVSMGVAQYTAGESIDDWLGRADHLLYRAKNEGRNRVVWEESQNHPPTETF